MLQLRANTSARSPPHSSFWKFVIGSVVCGGRNSVSFGNVLSMLITPFSRPIDVVRILNAEPGMYRSWYALFSSGLPGAAFISSR